MSHSNQFIKQVYQGIDPDEGTVRGVHLLDNIN